MAAKTSTTPTRPTPDPTATSASPSIEIDRVGTETLLVPIVGTSPLVMHKFSEKAKRQMLDNMQGRKTAKQPKDPEADFKAAAYHLDDGTYGFPTLAFKAATVSAARFYGKAVSMTALRQFVFFEGEYSKEDNVSLTRLEASEPVMREDVVRVGMGTDLRYRPEFNEWRAVLKVTFVKNMLSRESVLSLIEAGGLGVGVGEWRPERSGDFGTYRLDDTREVEVIG